MVIRTYFSKNNTIVKNSNINTGLNPVTELFYGGNKQYSRFLFQFDETRLKSLYSGGTFTDLSKLKHTLRMTNTGSFDKDLLNGTMSGKKRASSFDLILFKINQSWDNGYGYDYKPENFVYGENAISLSSSNWFTSQTGINWVNGPGVYSGSPTSITIATQHFDKGNENIEMDITPFINGVITGDTSYGLGIAYATGFEQLSTEALQYVGFFTHETQTFYEPFIETTYFNHINDNRNNFYLDKPNKLYLYVNLGGNPTNLDSIPSVNVYDQNNVLFSAYTSSGVTHVTKGVYSIDITVPTTSTNNCTMYTDIWSGITIGGVTRPEIELNFAIKDSLQYYNIGNNDTLPKKVAITVSGVQNKEKITDKEVRKIIVSALIPYTINQTEEIDGLEYRLYVKEGRNQLTVIDYQPVEIANNYSYFLLDTMSLLPNTYYLDVKVKSNLEISIKTEVISFEIVSISDYRKSQ